MKWSGYAALSAKVKRERTVEYYAEKPVFIFGVIDGKQ